MENLMSMNRKDLVGGHGKVRTLDVMTASYVRDVAQIIEKRVLLRRQSECFYRTIYRVLLGFWPGNTRLRAGVTREKQLYARTRLGGPP